MSSRGWWFFPWAQTRGTKLRQRPAVSEWSAPQVGCGGESPGPGFRQHLAAAQTHDGDRGRRACTVRHRREALRSIESSLGPSSRCPCVNAARIAESPAPGLHGLCRGAGLLAIDGGPADSAGQEEGRRQIPALEVHPKQILRHPPQCCHTSSLSHYEQHSAAVIWVF